jgi:nucleotide-binding universal stress UspA family protein
VTGLRRPGPARGALLDELREGAYDLVVVGAGRRSRLARALLRRAPVEVLVVDAQRSAVAGLELVPQGA